MIYLKKYEDFIPVEYENPKVPDEMKPTYKAELKKKKIKNGEKHKTTIITLPNHAKDGISFMRKGV